MKKLISVLSAVFIATSAHASQSNNYFCSVDGFSTTADPSKYAQHISTNLAKQFLVKVEADTVTFTQVSKTSMKYTSTLKIFERWNDTVKAMDVRADTVHLFIIEERLRDNVYYASKSLLKPNVVNGWEMLCDRLD